MAKDKLYVSPTSKTTIKHACFHNGRLLVFPNEVYKDIELSIDTIKTLFGEQSFLTKEECFGRSCIAINNADFFVLNSISYSASVTFELEEQDGDLIK